MYHYFVCLPFFTYWWLIAGLHSWSKKDSGWHGMCIRNPSLQQKCVQCTTWWFIVGVLLAMWIWQAKQNWLKQEVTTKQRGLGTATNAMVEIWRKQNISYHIIPDIHESNIRYVAEPNPDVYLASLLFVEPLILWGLISGMTKRPFPKCRRGHWVRCVLCLTAPGSLRYTVGVADLCWPWWPWHCMTSAECLKFTNFLYFKKITVSRKTLLKHKTLRWGYLPSKTGSPQANRSSNTTGPLVKSKIVSKTTYSAQVPCPFHGVFDT